MVCKKTLKYATSFFGVIDLLSILPSYIGLFISGAQAFMILRSIRLLRVFRVLKMVRFLGEASELTKALRSSRPKITVFVGGVFIMVVILGTIMYIIENGENGFTSIPKSIYWAVVTLTTVGYGDIAPQTPLGQAVATFIMILGYGIIAVPTGIVTSEMASNRQKTPTNTNSCPTCSAEGHRDDAVHCYRCGASLHT
nr:ion transporter [Mangrovivirga cuniculi]